MFTSAVSYCRCVVLRCVGRGMRKIIAGRPWCRQLRFGAFVRGGRRRRGLQCRYGPVRRNPNGNPYAAAPSNQVSAARCRRRSRQCSASRCRRLSTRQPQYAQPQYAQPTQYAPARRNTRPRQPQYASAPPPPPDVTGAVRRRRQLGLGGRHGRRGRPGRDDRRSSHGAGACRPTPSCRRTGITNAGCRHARPASGDPALCRQRRPARSSPTRPRRARRLRLRPRLRPAPTAYAVTARAPAPARCRRGGTCPGVAAAILRAGLGAGRLRRRPCWLRRRSTPSHRAKPRRIAHKYHVKVKDLAARQRPYSRKRRSRSARRSRCRPRPWPRRRRRHRQVGRAGRAQTAAGRRPPAGAPGKHGARGQPSTGTSGKTGRRRAARAPASARRRDRDRRDRPAPPTACRHSAGRSAAGSSPISAPR